MKDIRRRIKSVESTMQITKAMELVASSKLRKAKERAEKTRPFFNKIYSAMSDIAANNTDFSSVYTKKREVKSSLYIVIAGERGLAGGYNSNVLKMATLQMQKDANSGKKVSVMTIGKKSADFFLKQPYNVVADFVGIAEDITTHEAIGIATTAINEYKTKKADEIFIVFTQFISSLTQEPQMLKILPLSLGSEKGNAPRQLVIYEPSPEEVFDSIVPQYISGVVFGGVVESFASEQGARRTAMESASDNAVEMIDHLSLVYNRARQSAITQEISEIVAGANASN